VDKKLHAIWVMYNNQIATSVLRQQISDYEDAADIVCAFAYPFRELLSSAHFSFLPCVYRTTAAAPKRRLLGRPQGICPIANEGVPRYLSC
jgi:hypothetical protein